jgi:hypothetical protein
MPWPFGRSSGDDTDDPSGDAEFGARPPIRVLVASGRPIDLTSTDAAKEARKTRQAWQADAWDYYHEIPELHYGLTFEANCSRRMKIFPAAIPLDEPDSTPVRLDDMSDIPDDLKKAAEDQLKRLGTGPMGTAALLGPMTINWKTAGECYLAGHMPPGGGQEEWSIRSVSQVIPTENGWYMRDSPADQAAPTGSRPPLDPNEWFISRMWRSDSQWPERADSPCRALLHILKELALLTRNVEAAAKSRLAANGILKVPDGLTVTQADQSDDNPVADSFMASFTKALVTPMMDHDSASGVVPIILRGPAEDLALVEHLAFDFKADGTWVALRDEAIARLATGMEIPRTVLTGAEEANHWSAWAISDDTFRHHVEPTVIELCDALTSAFLWVALDAYQQWPPELIRRVLVWYDPVELVSHPDRSKDAFQLHQLDVISDEALRIACGFTENDKPTVVEQLNRAIMTHQRTWPPAIVEAVVRRVDPTLDIETVDQTGSPVDEETEPGKDPENPEEDPENPEHGPPEDAEPPVAEAPPKPGKSKGPAKARVGQVVAFTGRNSTDVSRAITALGGVDRSAGDRVQVAADEQMRRALERTGNTLRTRVRSSPAAAALIDGHPNWMVPAILGEKGVLAVGLPDRPTWDGLHQHWTTTLAAAGVTVRRQVATLARAAGRPLSDSHLSQLTGMQDQHAVDGWEWLSAAMDRMYDRLLYDPLPEQVLPDGKRRTAGALVSMLAVRGALALAGGAFVGVASAGLAENGRPVDRSEMLTGLGSGPDVQGVLATAGVSAGVWMWVHGGTSSQPFLPHVDLDGVEFTGPDDPVLSNSDGWPDGTCWFGDHDGCGCYPVTLWEIGSNSAVDAA